MPGPLVTADWLAQNKSDPAIHVIEVDDEKNAGAYAQGHIPGATQLVLQTQLEDQVARDFSTAEQVAAALAERGVNDGDVVVLYNLGPVFEGGIAAVYAYWVLKLRGVNVTAAILDGGSQAWLAAGQSLTTTVPPVTTGAVTAGEGDPTIRIARDAILSSLDAGGLRLLDVRTEGEYTGQLAAPPDVSQDIVMRTGHIPGAENLLWSDALTADGQFLPAPELEERYAGWLGGDGPPIATYCLRGERGVVSWFVLHELLAQPGVALYDGSWTEWGNLVEAPVDKSVSG